MKPTSWLAITIPAFVIGVVLLTVTIRSLLRVLRESVVASLPVLPQQTLTLGEAGQYAISVEGRLASTDFGSISLSLDDQRGTPMSMQRVIFRTSVSSFSRARLELYRFAVAGPGTFTLRASGIRPGADPNDRIVVGRAIGAALAIRIVGIVLCGIVTIGSLVGSVLLVVLPGRPAAS